MGDRVAFERASPWAQREYAMRRMSKLRREVVNLAIAGVLPTPALRERYLSSVDNYNAAHERWLVSRRAGDAAAAAHDAAQP